MARISPVTVAAVATAAVAGAGVGYVLGRRSVREPGSAPNPAPNPPRQPRAPEPPGGYEARWHGVRDRALDRCRRDPSVQTLPQAVAAALNQAYPEAAPWVDPGVWSPWMADAADLVDTDVAAAASRDGRSPRGWEIAVWLRAHEVMAACQAYGARAAWCAAELLYPGVNWNRPMPWQLELVRALQGARP